MVLVAKWTSSYIEILFVFVCVEVLWPSQPNGVMLSLVSLPNHNLGCILFCHIFQHISHRYLLEILQRSNSNKHHNLSVTLLLGSKVKTILAKQPSCSQTKMYRLYRTRAGVCKTLCPQLPDSNTVWLQHCLAMTVTTVQIYDFNVILSKGNKSKIGDDWDKKKIRITYFFMRNQNMKFQNISIHGSKLMLYTIKQRH